MGRRRATAGSARPVTASSTLAGGNGADDRHERRDQPIVLAVEIDAPPESVWPLLTDPQRIAHWWGNHVWLEARPGGRFLERWTDPAGRSVVIQGWEGLRVTECQERVREHAAGWSRHLARLASLAAR